MGIENYMYTMTIKSQLYYAPYQFAIFRIILGLYLCFHFAALIPYAGEIWSDQGLLPDPELNFTYGVVPNVLYLLTSPIEVTIFVGILFVLALGFMLGFQRPIVALFLWYGWVCLFDRNNLISNPGIPYIGWILLCCVALPKGEPLSVSTSSTERSWNFPVIIFIGAWALMAVGYTVSGVDKWMAPSWRDGSAILHLVENPLARDHALNVWIASLPMWIIQCMTWWVLAVEILFLPFSIFKVTRKWIWTAMVLVHIGILLLVDFADLTIGMLMIHAFTFDARWLKSREKRSATIFFDGFCGICNNFVDFMMAEDRHDVLTFAPLQGQHAEEHLDAKYREDLSTVVYKEGNQVYVRSEAVLRSLAGIGGIWKLGLLFRWIPVGVRDYVYDFVAAHRFQWFGKKETCRMPTPEERDKILP